jgi:hypothetical protein
LTHLIVPSFLPLLFFSIFGGLRRLFREVGWPGGGDERDGGEVEVVATLSERAEEEVTRLGQGGNGHGHDRRGERKMEVTAWVL